MYKIVNIHRNARFPGKIYAMLQNEKGDMIICATLDYILDCIRDRGYTCENTKPDFKENK
jgi:hypothetical protein